jgi:hypothetical protein
MRRDRVRLYEKGGLMPAPLSLQSQPRYRYSQFRMRRLKHEAKNSTVMVMAVAGIKARVKRAAAGSTTTMSNTSMVHTTQVKPS